jgi:hypothetical protein
MEPVGNQPQTANSGLMFYGADLAGIQGLSLPIIRMFAACCDHDREFGFNARR